MFHIRTGREVRASTDMLTQPRTKMVKSAKTKSSVVRNPAALAAWRKKLTDDITQWHLVKKNGVNRPCGFKNKDGSVSYWTDLGAHGQLLPNSDANGRYFWLYTKNELTQEDKRVLKTLHVWKIQVMKFDGMRIYSCRCLIEGYKFQDLVNLEFTLSQKCLYSIFYPDVCRDKKKRWLDVV